MICSDAFRKQKCENFKNVSQTFFKLQSIPTYSVSDQRALIDMRTLKFKTQTIPSSLPSIIIADMLENKDVWLNKL